MAKNVAVKQPENIVHRNAILCETVGKEIRTQKLFLNYTVNPFNKMHTITGKPNSLHDSEEGEADLTFTEAIKRSNMEPVKKYKTPQTEAQEVGWITKPLIEMDRNDRRLNFPRQNSSITNYMEAFWQQKESEGHE